MSEEVPWDEFKSAMKEIEREQRQERRESAEASREVIEAAAAQAGLFLEVKAPHDWLLRDSQTGRTVIQYWPTKSKWRNVRAGKSCHGSPEQIVAYLEGMK